MEKTCKKCGESKPIEKFYAHPKTADRRQEKCIECAKKMTAENERKHKGDIEWILRERARCREKNNRRTPGQLNYPKREVHLKHRKKYPEKYTARCASQGMRPPFVGARKHHWSYRPEDARDVIWLSDRDHKTAHIYLVYDRDEMKYRTIEEGVLLETKNRHEEFIRSKIQKHSLTHL